MRAPAFWWRPTRGLAARLLSPIGALVGGVAAWRMARAPAAHLDIPVVCVGNPTVGGAGKTPVAIALAAALAARGWRPVFLTRGYGGSLEGPVRLTPQHTARQAGDEPLLLAAHHPTVVSADRAAGGRLAATLGDVVVMDDGLQNPALHKDVALMVVDAVVGIGNGAVTPAGPMRAPFAAQVPHAHAIVRVTGAEPAVAVLPATILPVFDARLETSAPEPLEGVPVLAFAGIGRPQKFFASLEATGACIAARHAFGDHTPLTEREAAALRASARTEGLTLVTTTKDVARLAGGGPEAVALAREATVLEVNAVLPEALVAMVDERISSRRGAPAAG